MDQCPTYTKPIIEYESKLDPELYRTSVKQYEEREYEDSFRTLMNYINREMTESCEKGKNHWVIPHGSLIVEIKITPDGRLDVTAPFLKLPKERRAPLLRQATELNTRALTLSKLSLKDEGLYFNYNTPLELCEPFKLYGILYEICINGDSHDDEFVSKFGAVPLREKEVTYLQPDQVEQAWQTYQAILEEARRYNEYFTHKRWYGFCYDMLGIALMKIDHAVSPQGYIRTRLERSVGHLWDRRPLEEIVPGLTREAQEYRQLPREDFNRDFYRTTFFIQAKKTAEMQTCQKAMAERYDWSNQDKARRNHIGIAMNYQFASYQLMYSYFPPPRLQQEITSTLTACSDTPWEKAAEVAWASWQKIMDPAFA
jgi:hypothetical protein